MTQAQLASPEFSISYISAIERGRTRFLLKALSILARRLDVPLTFQQEGSPAGAAEARAVGYSPADAGPDQKIDVDLLQASVLVQQGRVPIHTLTNCSRQFNRNALRPIKSISCISLW